MTQLDRIARTSDEAGDLELKDWRAFVESELGQEQWAIVYCSDHGEHGDVVLFSALIPDANVAACLEHESWELTVGSGQPGLSVRFGKERVVTYDRSLGEHEAEPFVFVRNFHGVRPDYVEISEEFRLFHNLSFDSSTGNFVRVLDDGSVEDAIRFESRRPDCRAVSVRLLLLKQYLSVRGLHWASYFSVDRYSVRSFEELQLGELSTLVRGDSFVARLMLYTVPGYREKSARSRFEGKKLIAPMPKEQSGIWPYDEVSPNYEEFVIGTDRDGHAISSTCDPERLANLFGKNPDAPSYLTPVFFKREVLARYYGRPQLYAVEDGSIRCAGLWSLRIDNDRDDYVVVYLGDLGRDLPATERAHWTVHNVVPDGALSDVAHRRNVEAEFAEPESPELVFKRLFRRTSSVWNDGSRLPLFLDVGADLNRLHVPLTAERDEFEEQFQLLARILIDSVNTRRTGVNSTKVGRVDILCELLRSGENSDAETQCAFLRELDTLRRYYAEPVGQRGAAPALHFISIGEPTRTSFRKVLTAASDILKHLAKLADLAAEQPPKNSPKSTRTKSAANKVGRSRVKRSVDVAIITILPQEGTAIAQHIQDLKFEPGDEQSPNLYAWRTGTVRAENHETPYRVVLAHGGAAGNVNGALMTIETVERWSPRYVLMVGIAGGLKDVKKGDVVVSSHIWGYEYGKVGAEFSPRHDQTFGGDKGLLNCAATFGTSVEWTTSSPLNCPAGARVPQVVSAAVASGDKVVDNAGHPFFTQVIKAWPKVQAVEMEGAGAAAAIQHLTSKGRTVGFLMIRGISDLPLFTLPSSGTNESSEAALSAQTIERDLWKTSASEAAAAFSICFLRKAWPTRPR